MRDFENIYHEHYRALHSVAMKMLSDDALASDVLQEVFVSFFEIRKQGKEILKPKSYLLRATLNKCIDYSKRERRHEKIKGQYFQPVDKGEERKDNREMIVLALSVMNENDRQLLVLYSEGYSYKEIAELTNRKFNSVGKTLSRALKKMKEELRKLNYELS